MFDFLIVKYPFALLYFEISGDGWLANGVFCRDVTTELYDRNIDFVQSVTIDQDS